MLCLSGTAFLSGSRLVHDFPQRLCDNIAGGRTNRWTRARDVFSMKLCKLTGASAPPVTQTFDGSTYEALIILFFL